MSRVKEQSYILPLLNKNHLSATQEGNGTAKPEDGEEERKKKSQPEGDQKQRQELNHATPDNNNGATEEEKRRETVADGEDMDVEETPDTGNTTVRKTENTEYTQNKKL